MKNNIPETKEEEFYAFDIEESMMRFYNSLNEKDGRRYAGLEALKIGHGGRNYIAKILGCSRHTVSKGAKEVANLPKKKIFVFVKKAVGANLIRRHTKKLTCAFWMS